jgi:predicted amidohydrolase YtcJ
MVALRAKFEDIPYLTIPGLKVFADGVVEIPSQTAALTKPYLNTGRFVRPLFTPAKMNALVSEAYRRGLTVHIHALGAARRAQNTAYRSPSTRCLGPRTSTDWSS